MATQSNTRVEMTRLLVIGLCIVSVSFIAAELTCPEGEIVIDCPKSCKTTCPKSEGEAKESCPKPDPCPEPACQCRYFDRRADNGTCINTRRCPPFDCSARPNERFDPCPALCPTEDCSQASLKGRCPFFIGIVLICNPACRCIKDHYRKDGICVPEAECGNGSTTTVGPTEESTTPSTDDTWDFETQTLEIHPSEEISEANASATSDSTDKGKRPSEEISEANASATSDSTDKGKRPSEEISKANASATSDSTDKGSNQTIKPKDNPTSTQTADSEAESDNELKDDMNDSKPQANSEAQATSCMSTSEAKSSSDKKEKICGPNEEYKCSKSCPPDTCASNTIRCANEPTEVCKNGCYCKGGFLRANKTAPCRPQCDCENIANTDLCT